MTRRAAPAACLVGAVLVDALVATVDPTVPAAPGVTLAAVVAVGLARGPRVGALAGFAVGVVLDLLSGPSGLAGAGALACLVIGGSAGTLARRTRSPGMGEVLAGGVLVPCGVVSQLSIHGLAGWAPVVAAPLIGAAAAVGAIIVPILRRWSLDLPVRSVPKWTAGA